MPRPFNPFTHRYVPPARPDPATVLGLLRAHGADATRVDALAERWEQDTPQTGGKQAGNRNRARGDAAEARCRRDLREAGWHINSGRTGSFGAADIIAHRTDDVADSDRPGVDTLLVQVKRLREFRPSMLNAADADFTRLPRLAASNRLEMWAWADHRGWVAAVIHHQDGRLSGSGTHSEEVIQSIRKSRVTRAQSNKTTKQQRPLSFRERLEQ